MSLKCGIVGLPNVGKSSIFNALTNAKVASSNYPFCTIDPNTGVVCVPDLRLDQLSLVVSPEKVLPTTVEFVDIAGLVEGASKGEGLGNKFLANIRETHAIAHVVRCFNNAEVIHVAGKVNPIADIATINTELLLADLETVERALNRVSKNAKSNNKDAVKEQKLLESLSSHLDQGKPARTFNCSPEELKLIEKIQLITLKPFMYIANADENNANNQHLEKLRAQALQEKAQLVVICATLETEISELEPQERKEFLEDLGLKESGLEQVIKVAYNLLNLQTFFTAGKKEVRAWTVTKGSTAVDAAAVIHTDFAKGFIRAEVISYQDYIHYQGENGAKEAGKWRLEGKDYTLQDGDVIYFRFNV